MELKGQKAIVFAGPDFEDRELLIPYYRLLEAGASVKIAGLGQSSYTGKHGVPITCNGRFDDFISDAFDIVVIPGGWAPDKIRTSQAALEIVRNTLRAGKIVAAICHAGWVLASADVVRGKRVTSYHAIKDDLIHAGADWVDEAVVVDGTLVTSRTPDDLPVFMREIVCLAERNLAAV